MRSLAKPTVSVENLGCRVNRVESDKMVRDFASAGFDVIDSDSAQLIVINTCAVTGEAEAKTRKAVRHALGREQQPYVIATGCAVNLHADMLAGIDRRVTVEPSKIHVVDAAKKLLGPIELGRNDLRPVDLAAILGKSRVGVKIQDGCNNRCTYCIVWKARGDERSVPAERVIEQVNDAVAAGIPEVVLTGVNLGAYDGVSDNDEHIEIDELIHLLLEKTEVSHLRLGSVEPMDLNERLLPVMAAHADRVAPFLHLPVQSLCSSVLKRMGRRYSAEEFEESVQGIRAALPQAAVSCDLIVGFPGETDEEYEEALERARRIGFSHMHVFRYSARPGTVAADMPCQVDPKVMAERSSRIRGLARAMAEDDMRRRIGSAERAVLENGNQATLASYHRAVVDNADALNGALFFEADIMSLDENGLLHVQARA